MSSTSTYSRLTAAFRIDEQAQISREAAFILALAAVCYYYPVIRLLIALPQEELTKRLAQAGAIEMDASGRKELVLSDLGESDKESDFQDVHEYFEMSSTSTPSRTRSVAIVDGSGGLAGALYLTVNHLYHLISSPPICDFTGFRLLPPRAGS